MGRDSGCLTRFARTTPAEAETTAAKRTFCQNLTHTGIHTLVDSQADVSCDGT
ncbi:hypothetical protein LPJ81_005190, partial [Coemansia sp. IMI 209127]